MASIRQSIRSSTTSKRPTSAIADGQIALNTASGEPGLFFKDNANNIIKTGPAHYGASAPNVSPAVGGSTGNSLGEAWLDSALTPPGWKIWSGTAWVNATPLSSDTVQGLVELATNAETQAGVDTARAVTSSSLQSKVSDSISTASASGIASSTAVKTAYDLANAALPKSGGIITGNLEIGSTGSFTFEGSTADGFETTLAVVDPTVDRTITFPNITGTVVTTGDSGTVTSTMIADGTIVNADVSTSAAIAFSKLASLASANILVGNASGVATSTVVSGDVTITNAGVTSITSNVIVNADINSAAAIAYSKLALSSGITNTDISASAAVAYSKLALSNSIVNADINSAAAIAGTKISPDFGSQNLTTTGNITAANHITASGTATSAGVQVGTGATYKPGIYSPGADQLAISTNGTQRLLADSAGGVTVPTRFIIGQVNNVGGLSETTRITSGVFNTSRLLDGGTNPYLQTGAEAGIVYFNADGSSVPATVFRGGGTERLRITSTGALNFVGAGTAGSTQAVSFNGSAPVNSLVIDSSGRLGIGTSNPKIELQTGTSGGIQAANAFELAIRYNLYNSSGDKYIQAANKASSLVMNSDGDFVFYNTNTASTAADSAVTGLTARMAIKASGNVGIGVTSPSIPLQVLNAGTGNNTNNGAISLCRTSTVGSTLYHMYSTAVSDEAFAFSVHGGTTFSDTTYTKYLASAGGVHVWYGATTATERARIDSSGRLLVGTSNSAALYSRLQVAGGLGGEPGIINLLAAATPSAGNTGVGIIQFRDPSGNLGASISAESNAAWTSGSSHPSRLVFSTTSNSASSPTERMRITNGGLFKVTTGTQTGRYTNSINHSIVNENDNNWALTIENTGATVPYGVSIEFVNASPNDSSRVFLSCSDSTNIRAQIRSNGGLANYQANDVNLSDRNVKKDISPAADTWNCLKEWEIVNYRYKDQPDDADLNLGVIAQQVAESCPEVITIFQEAKEATEDAPAQEERLGVKEQQMYWMAIKALQEAQVRIEQLEAKVAALEAS